jgi:hypothetical protein
VLRNGAPSVAGTGTVPQVAGVVLGYDCGRGMAAGLLPGTGAIRVADYGSVTGATLRRVSVATIWRA